MSEIQRFATKLDAVRAIITLMRQVASPASRAALDPWISRLTDAVDDDQPMPLDDEDVFGKPV